MGSDFLQLDVREAPPGGLADWLAGQLRAAVADGRLPVGGRLPASRVLAAELRVSRGVVTEAYQRLIDDGHAAGRGRAGTVVVAAPVVAPDPSPVPPPAKVITPMPGVGVFDELRATPARIDLTPGVPDLTAFPRAAWLKAERAVLDELEPAHFGYGDPRGAPAMRLAVSHWLARSRGIRADPGEIIVVAGVAQALTLVGAGAPAARSRRRSPWRTRARSARGSTCTTAAWRPRRSRWTTTACASPTCARAAPRRCC